VGELGLKAGDLGVDIRTCGSDRAVAVGVPGPERDAGLERADAELRRLSTSRAVGQLCVEVRIDVPVPDAAQSRSRALTGGDPDRADAEQRLIVQDVLAAE